MGNAPNDSLSPLLEAGQNGILDRLISRIRAASRARRSAMFHSLFALREDTRILDLGGSDGTYMRYLLSGTPVKAANIYVADIDRDALRSAEVRFGYSPVFMAEDGKLDFPDDYFDIVFCSSVIEHVTVPKAEVYKEKSGSRFKARARQHQRMFAAELRRIGKQYFVQVPDRWFPIETHTWLPFFAYLPRRLQCHVINLSNRVWIKKTDPDFYLPTASEMRAYFPDAELKRERVLGISKSLIAVKY